MRAFIGFGLGVVLGAILAFGAGRKYESAHAASVIASGYVGVARDRWRKAAGSVVLFAVVVLGGLLLLWSGR